MNLAKAVAHSSGSKAKTTKQDGTVIIVQQRYSAVGNDWLHIWIIENENATETDMFNAHKLLSIYEVDPSLPIWNAL